MPSPDDALDPQADPVPAGRSLRIVLCGTILLALSIAIRLSFGLFLQPMSQTFGWGRETFAWAIALQNLVWGLAQPFTGMLADRYGARGVAAAGGIGYALGLFLMAQSSSPLTLSLSTGVLIGLALSATSFGVVLGAVGKAVGEERRSLALGLTSAGGSLGQFLMIPVGQALISSYQWTGALLVLAVGALAMVPLAAGLAGREEGGGELPQLGDLREALEEARSHRGYWLLTAGFFVCGFQVTFIATHLPAYLRDQALGPGLGATALALIGLFNILGSAGWGVLGGRCSKKRSLAILYLARSGAIGLLLLLPVSRSSVLLFAISMGILWLGTVPLTSGLVGQIFGVRYLSTLFGIVFLGHQAGAFLGAWLGGYIFDASGSYDLVWYLSLVLGVVAALLHWPIDEGPIRRLDPLVESA